MSLLNALDSYLPDSIRDPLCSLWLGCLQEDLRGWLRQHHLGEMPIDVFQLGLTLESKNKRIFALSVFGDGRVELWQSLKAGKLIKDKPYGRLVFFRGPQKPQTQPVNPEAMQRLERVPFGGAGGDEYPPSTRFSPFGSAPAMALRFFKSGQHT